MSGFTGNLIADSGTEPVFKKQELARREQFAQQEAEARQRSIEMQRRIVDTQAQMDEMAKHFKSRVDRIIAKNKTTKKLSKQELELLAFDKDDRKRRVDGSEFDERMKRFIQERDREQARFKARTGS
jgi:hypothetical protein